MRLPARLPSLGSLVVLAIVIVVLLAQGGDGGGDGADSKTTAASTTARVIRAIDGDTIAVSIGGRTEDVRYIGVDTPESVKPGTPVECYALDASHFNEHLVEGHAVRLDFDAEQRDVYGRLLAYVHLGDTFVNAELVQRGFATTLTIPPNDRYAGLLGRLEDQAAAAGRGLWSACRA